MRDPELLTLVLSSMKPGYKEILFDGQIPTWISTHRQKGFNILPYVAHSATASDLFAPSIQDLEARLARQSIITRAHLNQFRIVKKSPSDSSLFLSRQLFRRNVWMDSPNKTLLVDVPDSLATIGFSTLSVLKYSLDNYKFDFMVRTNTSSYVNLDRLQRFLAKQPKERKVFALSGRWGRQSYPSGALYVLSRETAEEIVKKSSKWLHDYIDDVALGILLNLSPDDLVPIPRYEFSNSKLDSADQVIDFDPQLIHYRCKANSATKTIQNMKTVHQFVGAN